MPVFRPVDREVNFPAQEARWMRFWRERDIFAKQLAQSRERAAREGKGVYVFYEGPPTANGLPHPGHVLTRVVKDLFPRFRAMQGWDVPRKAGWDTHGLPVEIEVEKRLGIEGKQGIEAYGVEAFVKQCRDSVFRYSDAWAKMTERIGFWIDLQDPYVTYHQSYIESVWWSLREIWDAGLLYHGSKIVPWCPRCGTALSSHEVGLGYEEVADPSVYVGFRSRRDPKRFFLAWTTTPWTLPSNVALAVAANVEYADIQVGDEVLVLAAALRPAAMGKMQHTVLRTYPGSALVGEEYEPLYTYAKVDKPAFRVIAADFVGLDVGTGIVHIAPAFGEDDARAGRENDLPAPNLVQPNGVFAEGTPWAGKFVKDADAEIIKDLKTRRLLLKSETYKHPYPFCWRCASPLLYYPRPAWYIATSTLKDKMLANNAAIGWLPEHIRDGRFGNFLETNVDWALSRERYWGTPLPIWKCASCGHTTAIGSRQELLSWKWGARYAPPGRDPLSAGGEAPADLDFHKPWIDNVSLGCPQCSAWMRRVSEVIDCWYDSGAMPFAQWGYPAGRWERGESAETAAARLASALPADFISEAIDQTRGWFYSLLAIATLLKECAERKRAKGLEAGPLAPWLDKPWPLPYRRCLVLGHVCDEKGFKMSKSKGNYLDPHEILQREGADALRWYFYISNQPWSSVRFFADAIRDSQREFHLRLRNVLSFFIIYANIDGFDPRHGLGSPAAARAGRQPTPSGNAFIPLAQRPEIDRWMRAKIERLTAAATRYLEEMDILAAARGLHEGVDILSNWYVRRSRDRFWCSGQSADKQAAYWTLYECLVRLSLLLAPFTPFLAEEFYQTLVRDLYGDEAPESVHLCAWPEADQAAIDEALEERMDLVREIASLGLAARASQKIKVRQPLREAIIVLSKHEQRAGVDSLAEVVRDEINVKRLSFALEADKYVRYTVKPNFAKLGPKLGPTVKAVAAALAKADANAICRQAQQADRVTIKAEGEEIVLAADELDIRLLPQEGFAAAAGRGAVVILDTHIDEELALEGVAREIINRIQNMRKEMDLPYEARIKARIGAGGRAARAILQFRAMISRETLAPDLEAKSEDLDFTREFVVEDEKITISLQPL